MSGQLVLATQTCDLKRDLSEEPTAEFLRAFWTEKQGIIVPAGRNSTRRFLLRERVVGGRAEGLVAEASGRVFIDKRSLLEFSPEQGCEDGQREGRFRRWLARRYDRPAVPDPVVEAVQRPVVEALRATPENAEVWTLLRGVRDVMYDTAQTQAPFQVTFLFVQENGLADREPLSEADGEKLAAWFRGVLAEKGDAEVAAWSVDNTSGISILDYFTFIPLPLDEYSP